MAPSSREDPAVVGRFVEYQREVKARFDDATGTLLDHVKQYSLAARKRNPE